MTTPTTETPQITEVFPALKDVFPYEYVGGGYFRANGVPKNVAAKILHGEEAIKHLYQALKCKLT